MKRMEIVANSSVESDITEALDKIIPDFYYTLLPNIQGKGKTRYKFGDSVWPELNFLIICYLDDNFASKAKEALLKIKKEFPDEGIKFFIMEAVLVG